MANVLPNLVDWARQADPDGAPAVIAEMLSQCNEVITDMIYQEGNLPLGHKSTVRVGLAQGTWRAFNQGVGSSKNMTAQVEDSIGELVAYSIVDKSLAELGGNVAKFRMNEDMGHIEGLGQQIASTLIYGNLNTNPAAFMGFSPRYNSVSTSTIKAAANVFNAGGTGSANSSIWLLGWGDRTTFGIFPKGSQAGLKYEDKGDIVPAQDANGNWFEAYRSYFQAKIGLVVQDWRYNVRICNIDTTTAGLAGPTPPDLFELMALAIVQVPTTTRRASGITVTDAPDEPAPGIRPAWYCNRTVRGYMDIQAMRNKNVLLSVDDYAGNPTLSWREIPIRVVDAINNSEVALS